MNNSSKPSSESILNTAYAKLELLLARAEQATFAVADQVRHLKDRLGQSFRAIETRLGKRANGKSRYTHVYVRDMYLAATHPERHPGASLNQHVIAAKSQKRTEAKITRETGTPFNLSPKLVISEVVKNGFSRCRPATDHLMKLARAQVAPVELQKSIDIAVKSNGILDRPHHCDWREVVKKVKPGSVRLWLLDPPYASYCKDGDGHLDVYGSSACDLIGCDNGTTEEAIKEVCDCFRLLGDKTHPNGVIALWQRGGWPRSEIVQASERHGWQPLPPFIWDKHSPQPTDFESPTYSTEFCWLFSQPHANLSNFAASSRQQVLSARDFPPLHGTKRHIMQKPESLSTFLIEKFTRPRDIVGELFGCSGSGCVAAIRSNRYFIYSESLKENFDFGAERIAAELSRNASAKNERKSV